LPIKGNSRRPLSLAALSANHSPRSDSSGSSVSGSGRLGPSGSLHPSGLSSSSSSSLSPAQHSSASPLSGQPSGPVNGRQSAPSAFSPNSQCLASVNNNLSVNSNLSVGPSVCPSVNSSIPTSTPRRPPLERDPACVAPELGPGLSLSLRGGSPGCSSKLFSAPGASAAAPHAVVVDAPAVPDGLVWTQPVASPGSSGDVDAPGLAACLSLDTARAPPPPPARVRSNARLLEAHAVGPRHAASRIRVEAARSVGAPELAVRMCQVPPCVTVSEVRCPGPEEPKLPPWLLPRLRTVAAAGDSALAPHP